MNVYKFGGASIATPERAKALWPIIQSAPQPLVIIVSALGKTTNALEAIVNAATKGLKDEANTLVKALHDQHDQYARTLLSDEQYANAQKALNEYFTEIEWTIGDAELTRYDYWYDQIVSVGELLSTRILSAYWAQQGYNHQWMDARDLIRTDDTFRDAKVYYDASRDLTQAALKPLLEKGTSVLTQGFIGATTDNASITLGREGSDYTAALLASMLGAEGVTIWKDVEGLQNADPKEFPDTVKIDAISYHEVIEMAFYGAQVIHQKTIKPLQNANIPLYVKCFLNKDLKGTIISNDTGTVAYPPLIIQKKGQVLLQATTRDFSFITEDNLSHLYRIFAELNIKINLMQHAAISFVACLDHQEDKLQKLIDQLEGNYKLLRNEGVTLLTVRHYAPEQLFGLINNRQVLLEQKTRSTVQVVIG